MIKAHCFDSQYDCDEGIHLLFTTMQVVQESLGFSHFELVFCHTMCGPLKVVNIKDGWLDDTEQYNVLDYVSTFKYTLFKTCDLANKSLKEIQYKMKNLV